LFDFMRILIKAVSLVKQETSDGYWVLGFGFNPS